MNIHPSISHFDQFFRYEHLPLHLQEVSKPFADLAAQMVERFKGQGQELAAGLRKLLEAKDCMVRAAVLEFEEAKREAAARG